MIRFGFESEIEMLDFIEENYTPNTVYKDLKEFVGNKYIPSEIYTQQELKDNIDDEDKYSFSNSKQLLSFVRETYPPIVVFDFDEIENMLNSKLRFASEHDLLEYIARNYTLEQIVEGL